MATKPEGGNKKLVLIGGLVVVAAAVLGWVALDMPPGGEDTAGTIGAVKKFRAGQIDDVDVVLGGDVQRPNEAIAYDELIAGAGSLEAMSSELNAMIALGAKDLMGAKSFSRLRAMSDTLEARKLALNASAVDSIRGQLNAVSELLGAHSDMLEAKSLAKLKGELGAMTQSLEAKKMSLGAKDLAEINDRLGAMSVSLGKAADLALGAKDFAIQDRLGAMKLDLGAKDLSVQKLNAMSADLGAAVQALGAKDLALGAKKFAASVDSLGAYSLAAKKIDVARKELGAAIELGAGSQLEAKSLDRLRGSLGAMSNELGAAARDIQERSLGHMKFSLDANSKHLSRLNAMSDSLGAVSKFALGSGDDIAPGDAGNADQAAGGRGGVADFGTSMGEFKGRLGAFSDALEARKLQASSNFLGNMKFQLGAANRLLGANSQLGKSAVADLSGHLGNVKMSLNANSKLALGAADQLGAMKQLGAVSQQLEAKAQDLGAKFQVN